MSSEVEICNLALSHLGDNATVASLDPPEGSAQAEHCARFYPMARDSLLEIFTFNFETRRARLARLGSPWKQWAYAYAKPADCLRVLSVESENGVHLSDLWTSSQDYLIELNDDLVEVIYTNQPDAVLKYGARITDPILFSPLFVMTLSHHLASMMAGPIIKGDVGQAEAKRQSAMVQVYLSKASLSDANQQRIRPAHTVSWLKVR